MSGRRPILARRVATASSDAGRKTPIGVEMDGLPVGSGRPQAAMGESAPSARGPACCRAFRISRRRWNARPAGRSPAGVLLSTILPSSSVRIRSAEIEYPRIVRDHERGGSALLPQCLQHAHHLQSAVSIQCGGRLVGKHDLRIADERSCNRDALLLSAGEVGRKV